MIKKYSLSLLEKAINHALALDSSSANKIHALDGKIIELLITPLNVRFYIYFTNDQLKLKEHSELPANTTIQSSPIGLIRLSLLPASQARSLFNDKVRMSGDIELGEKIKQLFNELDIDWEGHLAHFTGDVVAFQIGNFVRQGMTFKQQLSQSFKRQITEYVQEEIRLFPSREELNDFFNDVDKLLIETDRLEALITLLKDNYEVA